MFASKQQELSYSHTVCLLIHLGYQFEFCEKPTTAYIMVARGVASVQ